jgi:hypothetical protein
MHKLVFSVATAALLAAGSVAYADDELISPIRSVNATAGTITLLNNTAYKVPDSVKASDFKTGEIVRITYKIGVNTAVTLLKGGSVTGTVTKLDDMLGVVTLDNGKTYMLLPTVEFNEVKVGTKVKLNYAPRLQDNANMVATVEQVR